jgi:hypothetical protein
MCNASMSVQNLIKDVVAEFVKQGKTFTAYEVNQEVHNRTSEDFTHAEVRDFIHKQMTGQAYGKRLKDFGSYRAIQYFPHAAAGTPNLTTMNKASNSLQRKPNKSKRLVIPRKTLSKAGFKAAQKVEILLSAHKKALVVVPSNGYQSKETLYTVDCKGNIAISQTHLDKITNQGPTYEIKVDHNKVVVE